MFKLFKRKKTTNQTSDHLDMMYACRDQAETNYMLENMDREKYVQTFCGSQSYYASAISQTVEKVKTKSGKTKHIIEDVFDEKHFKDYTIKQYGVRAVKATLIERGILNG